NTLTQILECYACHALYSYSRARHLRKCAVECPGPNRGIHFYALPLSYRAIGQGASYSLSSLRYIVPAASNPLTKPVCGLITNDGTQPCSQKAFALSRSVPCSTSQFSSCCNSANTGLTGVPSLTVSYMQ